MTRVRSSLERFAPLCREPDPSLAKAACAKVWHETGLIVINPEMLTSWTGRKQAELLAEKLYGKRKI